MLTPERLEEVACWMRVNGVHEILAVRNDGIHLHTGDLRRLAPEMVGVPRNDKYNSIDYTETVDGQSCFSVDMDMSLYFSKVS